MSGPRHMHAFGNVHGWVQQLLGGRRPRLPLQGCGLHKLQLTSSLLGTAHVMRMHGGLLLKRQAAFTAPVSRRAVPHCRVEEGQANA